MSLKDKIQTALNTTSSMCSPALFELITQWQKWLLVEKNTSQNTCYNYLQDLKAFVAFYLNYHGGAMKPSDIPDLKAAYFRAFLTSRIGSGVSARSNARAISTLRNFFKYTAKRHSIANDEINIIKTPRLSTTLPRPMGNEAAIELTTIANYSAADPWQNKRDMTLFLTLYGCGLRISEALGLNVNDVVNTDHLLVTGKRNKQRMIPLMPLLQLYLNNYISDKPPSIEPVDPLFIGTRGERLSPGVAQRAMRRLRTNLGLPDNITPHSLRHSFATHLLQSGADLRSIQELLGHASLTSTQKYTQIDITSLKSNHKAFHPRG